MASSDDEDETVPHVVSNYHFVNDKDEPTSFSELPVLWNDGAGQDDKRKQVFLHGTADNGLQKIYKQVTAWKFDLSVANPEILVLSKENNWIKLQKPRKSFEDIIRTILISVHCLHFVKKNPEISERSLWDHLSKVFSFYETRPSENDLIDQISLISEAVGKDETLAKSKFLVTFLEGKHVKKDFDKDNGTRTKPGFIVDDDMIDGIEEDDGSDEEEDLFDSVCAICDNGGDILCCEGRCMRSFHATEEAGSESACESLGLSNEQVEAVQNFFCKNCQHKKHQCFACGELGSSDKLSGAEVFPCVSATCGHFYHPHCVANLLHRESAAEAEERRKKIAAGESFTCPIHKCIKCKQGENKTEPDWQFAVCRRCPKSYHRKCLPKRIAFEDEEDEGIVQRAWEDLIPNRILIYCLDHEIDDELGTPIRNHIKFPGDGQKKKKQASEQIPRREKVLEKERTLALTDASRKRTLGKLQKGLDLSSIKAEAGSKISVRRSTVPDSSKKQKVGDTSRKPLNNTASAKVGKLSDVNKPSLGERLFNLYSKVPEPVKSRKDSPDSEHKQTLTDKPVAKEMSNLLSLDDDSKWRIMALVKDATYSITQEKIIERHKLPTTHAYSARNVVDRNFTLGKVEGSCEAIRAALKKLEDGCSLGDAKEVCDTSILDQIIKWKNKLKVYLAPFLYGMRYTSYGRHFTKVDKLKEIVDVLHCYVQDGDMVVDFCCGSNDFSCLMKKKLDETGVRCSYKNYDILQAKNDFNFEKRDWMSVQPKELPTGSQLIMGLNPPFGVNAGLANKFIDKALEFKPKLLIIIAPRETERLNEKNPPYDLVWEDDELLSGRSFYLPGSVDINDNQLDDWNVKTSLLYLWSRPDWTAKHKAIAQRHGHFGSAQERLNLVEDHHETLVSDHSVEVHDINGQTSMAIDNHPVQNEAHEPVQERGASVAESDEEIFLTDNGNREVHENSSHGKNLSNEHSKKRLNGEAKHRRRRVEKSPEFKERGQSSVSGTHDKIPHHSPPPYVTRGRSPESLEEQSPPSHMEVDEEGHNRHFEAANIAGRRTDYHSRYVENRGVDDIAMSYGGFNSEEPYSGVNHRWSSGTSPGPGLGTDYRARNSDEQFAGYRRDGMESHGYRSHVGEREPNYITESSPAFRSQARLFGHPHPDTFGQRSSYLAGGDAGFPSPYSNMGSAMDSSYDRMNTSAMQRYAPRLDELNPTRTNSLGSLGSVPPPSVAVGRNGIPDPFAPPLGYRIDSMGFAPGPRRPLPHQNPSSGWLND